VLPGLDPLLQMQPLVQAHGESEVGGSDTEVPTPKDSSPRVGGLTMVEHILDKGAG